MWFDFKKLLVWKKSIELVDDVYLIVWWFPSNEVFWLSSQIKRSSVSIASNIAEWNDRDSDKDFRRFLLISKWSSAELETQLILSNNLWYLSKNDLYILNHF